MLDCRILISNRRKTEMLNYLMENFLPLSLNDVSTMKADEGKDGALDFLGHFLQAYELKIRKSFRKIMN